MRFSERPLKAKPAVKEVDQCLVAGGRGIAIEGPAIDSMGCERPGISEGVFQTNSQGEVVSAIMTIRDISLIHPKDPIYTEI